MESLAKRIRAKFITTLPKSPWLILATILAPGFFMTGFYLVSINHIPIFDLNNFLVVFIMLEFILIPTLFLLLSSYIIPTILFSRSGPLSAFYALLWSNETNDNEDDNYCTSKQALFVYLVPATIYFTLIVLSQFSEETELLVILLMIIHFIFLLTHYKSDGHGLVKLKNLFNSFIKIYFLSFINMALLFVIFAPIYHFIASSSFAETDPAIVYWLLITLLYFVVIGTFFSLIKPKNNFFVQYGALTYRSFIGGFIILLFIFSSSATTVLKLPFTMLGIGNIENASIIADQESCLIFKAANYPMEDCDDFQVISDIHILWWAGTKKLSFDTADGETTLTLPGDVNISLLE